MYCKLLNEWWEGLNDASVDTQKKNTMDLRVETTALSVDVTGVHRLVPSPVLLYFFSHHPQQHLPPRSVYYKMNSA